MKNTKTIFLFIIALGLFAACNNDKEEVEPAAPVFTEFIYKNWQADTDLKNGELFEEYVFKHWRFNADGEFKGLIRYSESRPPLTVTLVWEWSDDYKSILFPNVKSNHEFENDIMAKWDIISLNEGKLIMEKFENDDYFYMELTPAPDSVLVD